AVGLEALGRPDAVLLSHDHHFDNLDHAGRALLARAPVVLTTEPGAGRLGGPPVGMKPWDTFDVTGADGVVRVTATPARHGPAGGDRGPVVGFVLSRPDDATDAVSLSGDTVFSAH